jgi:hypothetical protein
MLIKTSLYVTGTVVGIFLASCLQSHVTLSRPCSKCTLTPAKPNYDHQKDQIQDKDQNDKSFPEDQKLGLAAWLSVA